MLREFKDIHPQENSEKGEKHSTVRNLGIPNVHTNMYKIILISDKNYDFCVKL
jgi:hypothetical protein